MGCLKPAAFRACIHRESTRKGGREGGREREGEGGGGAGRGGGVKRV